MRQAMRNILFATISSVAAAVPSVANAGVSYFLLPTPENNANATYGQYPDAELALRDAIMMNGLPVAFKYDDFWSYSAKLLESMQTNSPSLLPTAKFGAYNFSTGTGTIDVNLTSVAGGAKNVVELSDGTKIYLQDPANLASNENVKGWQCNWGGTTQYCDVYGANGSYSHDASQEGGTTTVGELLSYLQDIDPTWTIPVIYADYNQNGGADSLWFSAKVEIINPSTGLVVDGGFWQLDRTTNDTWDETNPTFNYGEISFLGDALECAANPWSPLNGQGCAGVTLDGADYTSLKHNTGSGHADFMVYADTMDLSKFDPGYLFVITGNLGCIPDTTSPYPGTQNMGCNTGGGEEFGIFGGTAPTDVPEPNTLALLAMTMGLLSWRLRKEKAIA